MTRLIWLTLPTALLSAYRSPFMPLPASPAGSLSVSEAAHFKRGESGSPLLSIQNTLLQIDSALLFIKTIVLQVCSACPGIRDMALQV